MSSYKEHQNLIKQFKLMATKELPEARFFDRHVAMLYTKKGRPVKINKKGMADLYGLIFMDSKIYHVEIEAKTGQARQTKEQKTWEKFIGSNNYYLMRNAEETIKKIRNFIDTLK